MALYRENIERIDLSFGSVFRNHGQSYILCEGDISANRFGVQVFRDGVAESLSGVSCVGYLIRPNGDTVAITGTVSGNTAYVILPQAAYSYPGVFTLAIKLVGGGVTGTMRIIDGAIVNTTTDTVVDPGSVVPDLTTLLAQISRMEAATTAAEGAVGMIAAEYDGTLTYALGDIVIHSGKLYRNKTAITTPEAWTASHWTQVTMGTAAMTHAEIDAAMQH